MEQAAENSNEEGLTTVTQAERTNNAAMLIEELESSPVKGETKLAGKDIEDDFKLPPGRLDLKQMEEMERQILKQQNELRERQEKRRQKLDKMQKTTSEQPTSYKKAVKEDPNKNQLEPNKDTPGTQLTQQISAVLQQRAK